MNKITRCALLIALGAAVMLTTGCTRTVSRGIDDKGVPDEVKWPDLSDERIQEMATSPNRENLAKIRVGLNKNDIFQLIGPPHFREMFGAREWDYIFKFRDAAGQEKVCQYKIIFDSDKLAGTFHWNPEHCASNFGLGAN